MFIVDTFVVVFPLTPWLDLFISILSMFCVHIVRITYHSVMLSSNKTVIALSSVWTSLVLSYGSLLLLPLLPYHMIAYLYYLPIM